MAEDLAEIAMEGVPIVAEHYDKVTDPVKDKTKQGINKVKRIRDQRNGRYESEEEYEEYDRYGPPQRSQTDRRRRSPQDDYRPRRRDGRGEIVEERYAYSRGNGRARSMGGDRQRGLSAPFIQASAKVLIQFQGVEETTLTPNLPSPHPAVSVGSH